LKDRLYQGIKDKKSKAQFDADNMFADLQQFMDPLHNKQGFSTQYRLSHLKKTGGHLPSDIAKLIGQ